VATGKVLSFDEIRGYGFIASSAANEDIFMHANDLLDEKSLLRPGVVVEFEIDNGDRGLKASDVRVLDRSAAVAHTPRRPAALEGAARQGLSDDETMCDVLSVRELRDELTEALLETAPDMSAAHILLVRKRVVEIARSHHWVEP
jgi:CspA family cold shock protein